MIGISMCTQNISIFGNQQRRNLARACLAAWPSAEAMALDLQDAGISRDPRTCQNWRNGKTEPRNSEAEIIRSLIRQQFDNKITSLRALRDAL